MIDTLRIRLLISVALIIFLVAGCARPELKPPVDTSFQIKINRTFDSLPNYSRVYFQGGMQVPRKALDSWVTYCGLYVYNRDHKADYLAMVKPGVLRISSVVNRQESSRESFASSGEVHQSSNLYASAGFSIGAGVGFDWEREGPPSYYVYKVEMQLFSPEQPDVKSLTCTKIWSTRGDYYPTLVEIRRALGDLVEIKTPTG